MSKNSEHPDPYSIAVMRKLDYLLDEPLSDNQRSKLEEALSQCKPKAHPVDLRGVLPLHFIRLYYVFLMGRDQRAITSKVDADLRQKTKLLANIIYWLVAFWPFYVILIFVYYVLTHLPTLYSG